MHPLSALPPVSTPPHATPARARRARWLVATTALALTVPLLCAGIPAQAAGHRKPLASVKVKQPGPITASARFVTLRGTATGKYRKALVVQRRTTGAWRTVRTFRGSRKWVVTVRIKPVAASLRVLARTARGPVRSRPVKIRVIAATTALSSIPLDRFDAQRTRILRDSNAFRAQHGLPPLLPMSALDVIATRWSKQMASVGVMSHNPTYWNQYPAGKRMGGENVAFGFPVGQVVAAWSKSPPHRANLLGDFNRIGIGYAVDRDGVPWYTQDFATY